jgi:membrane protease YdiL (CAAX protease family)
MPSFRPRLVNRDFREAAIATPEARTTSRQVVTFLIINVLLTAGVFVLMFSGPGDSIGMVLLMMWTPAISTFVTLAIFRERLSSLGWKLGDLRCLLESYALPVVVAVAAYGAVWATGSAELTFDGAANYRWAAMLGLELPVHPLVGIGSKILWGFLLFTTFIVGEEIGWSGFLVPKLLKVKSVPVTALITGVYWTVWHVPAVIGGMYGHGAPIWITTIGLTLVFVSVSLMRTVLVAKSGSLWTGTLLHLSHNTIVMGVCFDLTEKTDLAEILVSESGLVTGLVYVTVAIAYWRINARSHALEGCGAPSRCP